MATISLQVTKARVYLENNFSSLKKCPSFSILDSSRDFPATSLYRFWAKSASFPPSSYWLGFSFLKSELKEVLCSTYCFVSINVLKYCHVELWLILSTTVLKIIPHSKTKKHYYKSIKRYYCAMLVIQNHKRRLKKICHLSHKYYRFLYSRTSYASNIHLKGFWMRCTFNTHKQQFIPHSSPLSLLLTYFINNTAHFMTQYLY